MPKEVVRSEVAFSKTFQILKSENLQSYSTGAFQGFTDNFEFNHSKQNQTIKEPEPGMGVSKITEIGS